jgi:hypothetical protein
MGFLQRLFGNAAVKRQAAAADDLLDGIDDDDQGTVAGSDAGIKSSPKQVCRYIFQQMVAGRSASQLQTELQERGFKAAVADTYIHLIRVTMFKGR